MHWYFPFTVRPTILLHFQIFAQVPLQQDHFAQLFLGHFFSLAGLMVDSGFITLSPKNVPIKGFAPPANWRQHPHEWIIQYTRPKAASPFVLRCSLQEATGRLFIHASETGPDSMPRRENIQVLGLQLANYASKERCEGKSWVGCIQNERTLMEMFREFVSIPLWESAERVYEHGDDDDGKVDAEDADKNEKKRSNVGKATPRDDVAIASASGTGTDSNNSSANAGKGENHSGSRSTFGSALEGMDSIGITRKNMLLAVALGSGAATAFYFYKNYRETGRYMPSGVESLIPAFLKNMEEGKRGTKL